MDILLILAICAMVPGTGTGSCKGKAGQQTSTPNPSPYIYILSVVALDETNISSCLYFSMQNIAILYDIYRALGGVHVTTSTTNNVLCLSKFA